MGTRLGRKEFTAMLFRVPRAAWTALLGLLLLGSIACAPSEYQPPDPGVARYPSQITVESTDPADSVLSPWIRDFFWAYTENSGVNERRYTMNREGWHVVRIEVARDGSLLGVDLEEMHGDAEPLRATYRSLQEIGDLDSLPAAYSKDRLVMHMKVVHGGGP